MAQTPTPSIPVLAAGADTGRSDADGITNVGTPTLSGTAAPGATITLFDSDGVTPLVPLNAVNIADADGFWSIVVVGVLDDGFHEITAVATLPGESSSAHSRPLALVLDTAPPDPPTAPDLPAAQDTGISATDGITSKQVLQLTGHAEPNAIVQLYNMATAPAPSQAVTYSASLAQTVAGADGSYTLNTATLADGAYNFVVTATDVAGNVSKPSGATSVTVDSKAPAAPAAPTLSPGADTGVLHGDGLTDDASPVVVGTAEANATVELFDGAKMVGKATADGTGAYAITADKLDDGAHALTVKAVDAAGNVSAASAALNAVVDTTAPDATVTPADNDLGAGSVPFTVHFSEAVTGVAAADFALLATGTVTGSVQSVTGSGTDYVVTVSGLSGQGTVTLSLVPGAITDLAGNAAVLKEQDAHAVSGTTQPTTIELSTTPSVLVGDGTDPSPSASGRLVAFTSLNADQLATGPATDGMANVVVRDTLLGKTVLVSLDLDGAAANGASGYARISADGTEIAFASEATNLVDGGTQAGETNIYVAKLTEGANGPEVQSITLVSDGNGEQGEGANDDGSEAFYAPVLSADGSTVAFDSTQALVKGAESGVENVYSENVATGAITLVSGGTGMDEYSYQLATDPIAGETYDVLVPAPDKAPGTGGDMDSDVTSISADGRLIAYESSATDLGGAPVQVLYNTDVPSRGYVYNAATGATTSIDGTDQLDPSATVDTYTYNTYDPVLSGDGSKVFYEAREGGYLAGSYSFENLYQYAFATGVTTPVSAASASDGAVYDFGASASKGGGLVLFQDNPGVYADAAQYQAILANPASGTMTALSPGFAEMLTSAGNAYVFSEQQAATGSDQPTLYQAYETTLGVSVGVDAIGGDDAVDASMLAKAAAGGGLAVSGATNAPRGATVAVQIFGASATTNTLNSPAVLGTADGLGHWTATVPTALLQSADGNYALVVQVGTPAGNSFFSVRDFIVDTKAPDAPDAPKLDAGSDTSLAGDGSATSQDMPIFTGTAEAGATITLYDSSSATPDSPAGTATVDADGVYALSPTAPLINGKHALTVTATDAAGNASAMSDALTVTVDTIAPDAPNAPVLKPAAAVPPPFAGSSFEQPPAPPPGSDTGRSDSDGITSNASPTLTGGAEPNTTVTLYDTDGISSLGTAVANAKGVWEITPGNALAEGAHTLTVTATDAAGNVSPRSAGLAVVIDTLPPIAPAITSVSGDVVNGNQLGPIVDVTGKAEPDSIVTLTLDGAMDGVGADFGHTTASDDGSFTLTSLSIPPSGAAGPQKLQVTATDVAGNVSQPSLPTYVTIADLAKVPPIGSIQGNVLDGYISGAVVFADANGDGVMDPGEASAVTDVAGAFALTGGDGELVATGGTDVSTGLGLPGALTAPARSPVIDPLTTLIVACQGQTGASATAANAAVVAALGLPAGTDLTSLDPIAAALAGSPAAEVADAKLADLAVDFTAALSREPASTARPDAIFADVFTALAAQIKALASGATLDLDDPVTLLTTLGAVAGLAGAATPMAVATAAEQIAVGGNQQIDSAAAGRQGPALLAGIASVEEVEQGTAATALAQVGANPSLAATVVPQYTGQPLFTATSASIALVDGPPALAPGSDTGRSPIDDTTDVAAPTFTGTAKPGTYVTLFQYKQTVPPGGFQPVAATVVIGTTVADATGRYSVASTSLRTDNTSFDLLNTVGVIGSATDPGLALGQVIEAPADAPTTQVWLDPDSDTVTLPTIVDAVTAPAPGDDASRSGLFLDILPDGRGNAQGGTVQIYADGGTTPIGTGFVDASDDAFGITTAPLTLGPHTLTLVETLSGGTVLTGAPYAATVGALSVADGTASADGPVVGATVYQVDKTPLDDGGPFGQVQDAVSSITDASGGYVDTFDPRGPQDPLTLQGGYDTVTGVPLGGFGAPDLSGAGESSTPPELLAPYDFGAVTPLTTLLAQVNADAGVVGGAAPADNDGDEAVVLHGLGLSPDLDLATLNPVADAEAGDAAPLLATAKLLDTVTILSGIFGFDFRPVADYIADHGAIDLDDASQIAAAYDAYIATDSSTGLPDFREQAAAITAALPSLAAVAAASNQAIDAHAAAASSAADTISFALAAETVAQEAEADAVRNLFFESEIGDGTSLAAVAALYTGAALQTAIQAALARTYQVTSLAPVGPASTGAPFVTFSIAFSQPVTGLSAANFSVEAGGALAGAHVAAVTPVAGGGGAAYDVSVATGIGRGTLTLAFAGGGLANAASKPITDGVFAPAVTTSSLAQTQEVGSGLAVGDFNGDGRPDVAVGDGGDQYGVTLFLNNGQGGFVAQAPVAGAPSTTQIEAGDFNGDGKLDVVEAGSDGGSGLRLSVLLGNGDGSFQHAVDTPVGGYYFATGDFNGDGRLDVATSDRNAGGVSMLLGNGDGTFTQGQTLATAAAPDQIVAADFNGDGKLDLATLDDAGDVLISLGNGDGTLTPDGAAAVVPGADGIAVGDLNGDGITDIAVAGIGSDADQVTVLLGNGDGTFRALAPVTLPPSLREASAEPSGIAIADLNDDGKADLALSQGSGTIVLVGDGDGTFQPGDQSADGGSAGVALADVDGDGRIDILEPGQNHQPGGIDGEVASGLDVLMNEAPPVLGSTSAPVTIDRAAAAAPSLSETSGGGTFTQSGTAYTLDLGTLALGAATTATFSLANTAAAPADSFDGTFSAPAGGGFAVAGASLPQAVAAGGSYGGLSFTANTGAPGTYSETITFAPRDATAIPAAVATPDPDGGSVSPAATPVVDPVAAELPAITLTVTADVTPCFHAGTRIATPDGPVAVETLRVGDLVSTASGGARPVVWIGRRRVDCTRHPRPELVHPVRISAGAFGPRLPSRDLILSPDHAVFAEGVLIPVKRLVNGASVSVEPRASVEYFHVELDRHDIVLAEGLPTESYLDTGDRGRFAGGALVALHPDFSSRVWEADGCAPLRIVGAEVDRVRGALVRRAKRARAKARDAPSAEAGGDAGQKQTRPVRTSSSSARRRLRALDASLVSGACGKSETA